MNKRYYYKFAGVEYLITAPESVMYSDARRLKEFAVDHVRKPQILCIEKTDRLSEPQGQCVMMASALQVYTSGDSSVRYYGMVQDSWEFAHTRAERNGFEHLIQFRSACFPGRISVKALMNAMEVEHQVVRAGGFVLHCSYIDWQGRGILFTAPSGTGKSTQAELWMRLRGADIINGDRAAVRIADDTVLAEGIPFAGSSEYCKNRSLPLAAIVYLSQSPSTSIRRMLGYEAFARIWEGCSINTWDKVDMSVASDTVSRVVQQVPVFHLACTPDESAVIALEQQLNCR